MTPIKGPLIMTIKTEFGTLRAPVMSAHIVGDRLVPSPIEVDFPGGDGQPALHMLIEVIDGVPRCTELALNRSEGGREIRQKDLRAIEVDSWVETFVSLCSSHIQQQDGGKVVAVVRDDEKTFREGMRTIRNVRKGSRRPMTPERLQRVAEIYNAQETGGIEAVEAAFTCSRSTAIRYISKAREAGLIEGRTQ